MTPELATEPVVTQAAPPPSAMESAAAKETDFRLSDFRKAKDEPPVPVVEPTKVAEPDKVAEGAEGGVKTEIDPASEAGRTLAAHKSGLEKRKASIQGDIDKLTHDKHATRREVDEARRELQAVKAEIVALKGGTPAAEAKPAATTDTFPSFEDFLKLDGNEAKDWEAYNDARIEWRVEQRITAEKQHTAQQTAQQQRADAQRAFLEGEAEGTKDFPDYAALAEAAKEWPMSPQVEYAVLTSPRKYELAYYLLQHPEEAEAFSQLAGNARAVRSLMEARLPAARSGPALTPPMTKAQTPIKPVGTAPTASTSVESIIGTGTTVSLKALRAARDKHR